MKPKKMDKKKKTIINVLLVLITITLFLLGYYSKTADLSQILYISGIVIGFWTIMSLFKIKRFATED